MQHVTGRNRRRKTKMHQPMNLAAAESSEAALAQIAEMSMEDDAPAESASEAALARFSSQCTMEDVRRASVETAAVHAAAQQNMGDSPAASSEAALLHTAAQLAALKRGGRAGIVAAFSLCSRAYRDSFADPADFFAVLRCAPAFADLLADSSGIVSAEPLSATIGGDEQRKEAKVAIEVRIQGEEAPAGMPQRRDGAEPPRGDEPRSIAPTPELVWAAHA